MKTINEEQLNHLALGATLLGSGGGGDPAYELLMAQQVFADYGPPVLVNLVELPDDAFVVPLAVMGAPLVCKEKLPSGLEFQALMDRIAEFFGKVPTHLVAAEIGGANAFVPLIAGSQLGLPVVDADSLGRAFPELQMSSCHLNGISSTPAFLSDAMGHTSVVTLSDAYQMETSCREICMQMGSSATVAVYLMNGEKAKSSLIGGTVSQAMELGAKLNDEGVLGICQSCGGKVIGSGMIVDISQSICGGFLKGSFSIQCEEGSIVVEYQNEFLAAFMGSEMLASTPEIIIPLEEETAMPVTSESLQYGLRVILLELPAPSIWKTTEGLELVGPNRFNIRSQI